MPGRQGQTTCTISSPHPPPQQNWKNKQCFPKFLTPVAVIRTLFINSNTFFSLFPFIFTFLQAEKSSARGVSAQPGDSRRRRRSYHEHTCEADGEQHLASCCRWMNTPLLCWSQVCPKLSGRNIKWLRGRKENPYSVFLSMSFFCLKVRNFIEEFIEQHIKWFKCTLLLLIVECANKVSANKCLRTRKNF